MGVIHNSRQEGVLGELTQSRSTGAVPFGGRYRLIDFVLSNMVHSGIKNVAIFPYTQYRSLMDHLGSGKEWDLDRKRDGLFILPPSTHVNFMKEQNLSAFAQHMDYFTRSKQKYVVLASSYVICRINYEHVLKYHLDQEADVTFIYKQYDNEADKNRLKYGIEVDSQGFVQDIDLPHALSNPSCFLDMIIMERDYLIDIIERNHTDNLYHLMKDVLIPKQKQLRIAAYEHKGYVGIIDSVSHYFQHSMHLLNTDIYQEIFFSVGSVYTKVKDEPPTRYRNECSVTNSLIANGCHIEGVVENSILSRGVKVNAGAVVKNSIILQKTEIGSGTYLDHVILDKDVVMTEGQKLRGTLSEPELIGKGKIY